jgi:hypothetical protein
MKNEMPMAEFQKYVISKAKLVISTYPEEKNAEKLAEIAFKDGLVADKTEAMAVWGRIKRELRNG